MFCLILKFILKKNNKDITLTVPSRANNMKNVWYQKTKLFLPMGESIKNIGKKILHFAVYTMPVEKPGLPDTLYLYC